MSLEGEFTGDNVDGDGDVDDELGDLVIATRAMFKLTLVKQAKKHPVDTRKRIKYRMPGRVKDEDDLDIVSLGDEGAVGDGLLFSVATLELISMVALTGDVVADIWDMTEAVACCVSRRQNNFDC